MTPFPCKGFDETRAGPLAGVRVLDMSRLVAGNMATLLLADYGADVIKIERPDRGDDLRHWRVDDLDLYWKVYARNKRSLALDVSKGEGREIFPRLVRQSQVLVENFTPGTLERWGYSPQHLHEIRPGLVILRISGWGQTGPLRDKPGFGTLVEARSGYASLNGWADRPPLLPPLAMADMVAGLYGCSAVLAALRVVEAGGRGQVIDLSLFEPIFSLISSEALRYHVSGNLTPRTGNQASHTAPRNVYACADGGFVALSGSMQSMAERIFDTIGRPELKHDPRYATNDARVQNRDETRRHHRGLHGGARPRRESRAVRGGRRHRRPRARHGGRARRSLCCGSRRPRQRARCRSRSHSDARCGAAALGHAWCAQAARAGLGQHTDEILAEIGWGAGQRAAQ